MQYTPDQHEDADDANARTFTCVLMAAYLRSLNPSLSYYESLSYARAMPMGERIAILVAAATGEEVSYALY